MSLKMNLAKKKSDEWFSGEHFNSKIQSPSKSQQIQPKEKNDSSCKYKQLASFMRRCVKVNLGYTSNTLRNKTQKLGLILVNLKQT